jgi:hypothetical protein
MRDCDPAEAKNPELPSDAYLVTYRHEDDSLHYDITRGKQSDMFDYYWDHYRENFIGWKWADGRVNPKLYGSRQKEEKKKRK